MMVFNSFSYLNSIHDPADLRQRSEKDLPLIAQELREFLLHTLNESGGHFAANLGTVELTLALHYVFNTPEDRLVWDVGHQAYAHKVLTGRKDRLVTIRSLLGLAPFPKRTESPYDTFGVGHSSTSISAALGMAIAAKLKHETRKIVAVIGDGAMTAGMAFEALNHAGSLKANLLIVLNDNDMSISENVGALSNYFAQILSSKLYTGLREGGKEILKRIPPIREFARRTEEHLKGMLAPGTLFEELGINYLGPFDGHDLKTLVSVLKNVRDLGGPHLLHVITKKGQGYPPAEADPILFHAVKPGYLKAPPQTSTKISTSPTYSQIFGEWICDMAVQDPRLVGITPAMREGSELVRFSQLFPDRYFDVGIAEQHSVTLAAGLACEGLKPVVAIYSTFLQRAYDQVIHDVVLQKLPVLFAIDRAGLVGGDGSTHHGLYDIVFLRCLPHVVLMAPADENELRQMLYTGFCLDLPVGVRYPRGVGPGIPVEKAFSLIPLGQAKMLRQGKKIALLAFGSLVQPALTVGEQLDATVVNMRFIKPLDTALILNCAKEHELLVTLEEGVIAGGAGSAVAEALSAAGQTASLLHLGISDEILEHGEPKQLLSQAGLTPELILKQIQNYFL